MPVRVLFVSSDSGIVFTLRAGSITDHSQSAKDIDPYFKSQLYVEDPSHRRSVLILPIGLSRLEKRAHENKYYYYYKQLITRAKVNRVISKSEARYSRY